MNIFVFDKDPKICAEMHCNKHVVKMITEHTQMLSTACRMNGIDQGYRLTHMNHPCSIWVRESLSNWMWLRKLNFWLNHEYRKRYNKNLDHKSFIVGEELPVPNLPDIGMTEFAQAMPLEFKNSDPCKAYQDYFNSDKQRIAQWYIVKKTERFKITEPNWFKFDQIGSNLIK